MWRFRVTTEARDSIVHLDSTVRRRVLEKLAWFKDHVDDVVPVPLAASMRGYFKLRVGDWRIVYSADVGTHTIVIHLVDRRDQIYKSK